MNVKVFLKNICNVIFNILFNYNEETNATTFSFNDLQCCTNIQIYMNIYEKFFNVYQ